MPSLKDVFLLELRRNGPLRHRQRDPPANQREPTDWCHGTQILSPALRIQHQQIETTREHRHTRREETHGERVLRRCYGGECQDCGVNKLILGGCAPVR